MPNKPYFQACENNKMPVLEVIREAFDKPANQVNVVVNGLLRDL